jgi:hypothetical protein
MFSIDQIPQIDGLKELDCSLCPLLTQILHINGLQELGCRNCPLLTRIRLIHGLEVLDCRNCHSLTELEISDTVWYINAVGCVWLNSDSNFKESLKKLIYLQKWIRKEGSELN